MKEKNLQAQSKRALFSIVLFVLSYFLLIAFSIALIAAMVGVAIVLVSVFAHFITIILALALIGMAVMVFIFLLKFIFKVNRMDRSAMIEITAEEEPKLFSIIYELADEIGTKKPKHVYLSGDVNASVFYDSSFWSMFLPIQKNLVIGLGLVNSVSAVELKAILAHEFGHFSQKSMKVGSYVYHVNQIIFNALNDDRAFEQRVESWSQFSWIVYYATQIGLGIIGIIKNILAGLYSIVNLPYMKLSRQMEFHADSVAANITGSHPLINSLCRTEFSQSCLEETFTIYGRLVDRNMIGHNIYRNHTAVMNKKAAAFGLGIKNSLVNVTLDHAKEFAFKRLIIEDQWASHPTLVQRAENLREYPQTIDQQQDLAWSMFVKAEYWQKQLTQKAFENTTYKGETKEIPNEVFLSYYAEYVSEVEADKRYNEVYNFTNIEPFDIDTTLGITIPANMESLYTDEVKSSFKQQNELEAEIAVLQSIVDKEVKVKTFDFEGEKLTAKDAPNLKYLIEKELKESQEKLKAFHQQVYAFFENRAVTPEQKLKLKEHYKVYFEAQQEIKTDMELFVAFQEKTAFLQQTMPYEQILAHCRELRSTEADVKKRLQILLTNDAIIKEYEKEAIEKARKYMQHDLEYFTKERYLEYNLEIMFLSAQIFAEVSHADTTYKYRKLLQYQVELL